MNVVNQIDFRRNPNTDNQLPPSDIKDLYFPEFITHRDDENFVDCGAADGDTIRDFINKWNRYAYITAFDLIPSITENLLYRAWMTYVIIQSTPADE